MTKIAVNIPFEIHLTTNDLLNSEIERFNNLCKRSGGKSLLIKLSRGKVANQPMFSKVVSAENIERALEQTRDYVKGFVKEKFPITRIKVEIPIDFTDSIQSDKKETDNYFEWHGKIEPFEMDKLLGICTKHNTHLSKNSIKNESKRFVTLREYGSKEIFQNRVNNLIENLKENNYKIYKQESEYCVYDSNILLDEGWLTK